MLLGVLEMPPECWSDDPLDVTQRHGRYKQAADRIRNDASKLEQQAAELEQLKDAVRRYLSTYRLDETEDASLCFDDREHQMLVKLADLSAMRGNG